MTTKALTRRAPLPAYRNVDGRPVWEPPILDYSDLIGDEYHKKREALMKFTGNDVAKTTKVLDILDESALYRTHAQWVAENSWSVWSPTTDGECVRHQFFSNLYENLYEDGKVMQKEFLELDILLEKDRKGKWTAGRSHKGSFLPDDDDDHDDHDQKPEAENPKPADHSEGDDDSVADPAAFNIGETNFIAETTDPYSEDSDDRADEEGRPAKRRKLNGPSSAFVKIHGRKVKKALFIRYSSWSFKYHKEMLCRFAFKLGRPIRGNGRAAAPDLKVYEYESKWP